MSNQEYLQANRGAMAVFISNNYQAFKKDRDFFIRSLEYYAHCFGAGIKADGTEHDIISSSYSVVLVSNLFGSSLKIPIDSRVWSGWINDRLGAAFNG